MNQQVAYLGFGINSPEIKTNLHLFPYSGSISLTYPVDLSVTIFGQGLESLNVTMEGARLAQPDGLSIEKIFPALLANYSGTFGLLISITSAAEQEIDLTPSVCVIELKKKNSSVRYQPRLMTDKNGEAVGLGRKTSAAETKIVAVNAQAESAPLGILPGSFRLPKNNETQLPPLSVTEFELSPDYLSYGTSQLGVSGNVTAQRVVVNTKTAKTAYFIVDRESSGSPVAVQSL